MRMTVVVGCMVLVSMSDGDARAQDDGLPFAGVYAVRRVVTSSTCPGASVGGVFANVFMISAVPGPDHATLSVVVAGTRLFPELRGAFSDGTLALNGTNGVGGTISMSLVSGADGTLTGTESTHLVHAAAGECEIVRAVTAVPLTQAARARRHR